jgi:hypothetical protein
MSANMSAEQQKMLAVRMTLALLAFPLSQSPRPFLMCTLVAFPRTHTQEMGHGGAVFVAGRGESNGGDRQRSELKSSKGVMINDRPMTGSR